MTAVMMLDKPGTDTRSRIVDTAERLSREFGYHKTTVADIAKALRMSPANVYRFFDSKKAINEAVAQKLTAEIRAKLEALAAMPLPAGQRLRMILRGSHHAIVEMGVTEAKMMEMVEIAMTENWQVIEHHIAEVDAIMARVVADGIASGEFHDHDAGVAGACVRACMIRFCHPTMIVECANLARPTLDEHVEFVLAALERRPARQG